ncbi:MAG TPA: penicillin-binding protein 2 [Candidatus Nitrosocosmicus sp.]|nr:penicillin-binding protein 2 [Candidatus Nitrosocosmicus sp.]
MNRLRYLFYFFNLLLLLIVVKLFFVQIFASEKFASNNYLQTKKILPARGEIFDRNKQPLALNKTTYQLFVEPQRIKNKEKLVKDINKIISMGEATLEAKIDMSKLWVPITTNLSKEKKDKLAKLQLEGIGFDEETKRFYPESSMSAHLLGFLGKNENGEDKGYFGLEGFYQKDLMGLPGVLKTERDLFGNPIVIGVQDKLNGDNGRDLVLTIDKNIQLMVKNHLKDGIKRYGAKEGCVIVADPNTMEIIALSCLPDFDPGTYYKFSENTYKNPAISTLYEPGSIFKPLITAAGLNERVIKPDDTMNETGPTQIGEYKVKTWDDKYAGKVTMTQILEKSSNVGMVHIGQKLGSKKLMKYLNKFGIGQLTDIDLQGEVPGFIKPEGSWYEIDYATATFGQGIVVTPIQMITAFSSIINGGHMMRPYIVKEVISSTGEVNKVKPQEKYRVIDDRSSMLIRKMLESTVEHGEIRYAKPKGYKMGGKTGTAQIPIEGHYDPSKTIASFIGFAPVDKPRFVVLVSLKEPSTSIYGSETAAPLFFEVAKDLLVYYNMPSDE